MNYWESRKSFWTTWKGFIIQISAILILIGGAIIWLNLHTDPFPIIESLEADPVAISLGQTSNLSWNVAGATTVEIDQGIGRVSLNGNLKMTPSQTTTYSLTAVNGSRNRTKSISIIVKE